MTPEEKARLKEYADRLAESWPPLTPEQVEKAARILATVEPNLKDDSNA